MGDRELTYSSKRDKIEQPTSRKPIASALNSFSDSQICTFKIGNGTFNLLVKNGKTVDEALDNLAEKYGGGVARRYDAKMNAWEIVYIRISNEILVKGESQRVAEADFSKFQDSKAEMNRAVESSKNTKGGVHFFIEDMGIPMMIKQEELLFPNASELKVGIGLSAFGFKVVDYNANPTTFTELNGMFEGGMRVSNEARELLESMNGNIDRKGIGASHAGDRNMELIVDPSLLLKLNHLTGDLETITESRTMPAGQTEFSYTPETYVASSVGVIPIMQSTEVNGNVGPHWIRETGEIFFSYKTLKTQQATIDFDARMGPQSLGPMTEQLTNSSRTGRAEIMQTQNKENGTGTWITIEPRTAVDPRQARRDIRNYRNELVGSKNEAGTNQMVRQETEERKLSIGKKEITEPEGTTKQLKTEGGAEVFVRRIIIKNRTEITLAPRQTPSIDSVEQKQYFEQIKRRRIRSRYRRQSSHLSKVSVGTRTTLKISPIAGIISASGINTIKNATEKEAGKRPEKTKNERSNRVLRSSRKKVEIGERRYYSKLEETSMASTNKKNSRKPMEIRSGETRESTKREGTKMGNNTTAEKNRIENRRLNSQVQRTLQKPADSRIETRAAKRTEKGEIKTEIHTESGRKQISNKGIRTIQKSDYKRIEIRRKVTNMNARKTETSKKIVRRQKLHPLLRAELLRSKRKATRGTAKAGS